MAASANQLITRRDDCRHGHRSAAVHHYEGTFAFINSSGYGDVTTGSGENPFAGVVVTEVDNSGGAAGDLAIETLVEGVFLWTGSGFNQSTVGQRIYATDNNTITTDGTTANAVYIGTCVGYVSATEIYIAIEVESLKIPFAQQGAYTQTYNTAARTVPAATAVAVATTGASNSTPYGFTTAAQANNLVTAVNALIDDVLAIRKTQNALIDDLQAIGLVG